METPTPSRTSPRTTAILLVVVAFVAGLLIGAAGDRLYILRRGWPPPRAANAMARRALAMLDRELNLTSQQHAQIEQIMTRHHQRIEQIVGGVRPQVRKEMDAATSEIESVLTAEQKQKFQGLKSRFGPRGRHRQRDGESPPAPPRRP